MAKRKEYRDLTVGDVYRNGKSVPMLRVSGMWLEELGFKTGDFVWIKCEDGQLIISLNEGKAQQKTDDGYEMLSGHNRANAAKMAGLTEIPAIVKTGLSEAEAYVYVIETNLMQRSFAELMPSEKAAVMAAHYDKVCCQGKRNDIIRELQILSGVEPKETCCHNGNKFKSLDVIASEYGFSSRNAARYLRLNYLIQPFKNLMDENRIALLAAVDVSYLSEDEQQRLWNMVERQGLKIKPVYAEELRKASGNLTEEKMAEILEALQIKHSYGNAGVNLKPPKAICSRYFEGMNSKEMAAVVEQALAAWFEGKAVQGV